MATSDSTTKTCARCKNTYPATNEYFWIDKHTSDGWYTRCKNCGRNRSSRRFVPPDGYKRCYACKQVLPATTEYFYQNQSTGDGLTSECRGCKKKQAEERNQLPVVLEAKANWRKEHPDEMRHYGEAYKARNPDKRAAHTAVSNAIKLGKLAAIQTQSCRECGKRALHYHHWSYAPEHQLDVIPLCGKCHKKVHRENV